LQSVHPMRERLVHERTAKSNQIRSMFAEEGFIFPIGIVQLRQGIVALVADADAEITILLRRLGSMYLEQLAALQRWIDELASEIADIFKRNESCQRFATVPGIGPLVVDSVNYDGRPCCLKKECYSTDCCRFAFFLSLMVCRARSARPLRLPVSPT
jgi:transposase